MDTIEAKPEKNKEDDPHYKEFEGAMKLTEREYLIDCAIERMMELGL